MRSYLLLVLFLSLPLMASNSHGKRTSTGEKQESLIPAPKRAVVTDQDDKNWTVEECRSDGTCIYVHKITGERRARDSKKKGGGVAAADKFFLDLPKSLEGEYVPTVGSEGSANKDQELTKEEREFLAHHEIATQDDLLKMARLSKKAGRDTMLIQVGNLDNCPPCKAINAAIGASAIAKNPKVGVYDTNFLTLKDEALRKYLHANNLPQNFAFPHIFIFKIKDSGEGFSTQMNFTRAQASVEALEKGIKTLQEMKEAPPPK